MPDHAQQPRPDTVVAVYVETDEAKADPMWPTVGGEWEIHSDKTVTHLKPADPGDDDPAKGPKSKPIGPRRSASMLTAERITGDPGRFVELPTN